MRRLKKILGSVVLTASVLLTGVGAAQHDLVKAADTDEIMLATFFTSEEDCSDILYWSTDGENFYELSMMYEDSDPVGSSMIIKGIPSYRGDCTLHDPSIIYKDGYFWALSGFSTGTGSNRMFVPMMGYSDDLVHWSYPASGSETNSKPSVLPSGSVLKNTDFDSVAPDFMVDDDGTVYIVVSLGYYGDFHNDHEVSLMQPYLIKVNSLKLRPEADTVNNPAAPPVASYEPAVPINLPCMTSRANVADDHIDGSLYKEDGYYYLSIKENGVTDEIFRIKDLSKCSDASAWEEVCYDVVTGYEGPCLTKFAGQYFMYTDRLASYTTVDATAPYGTAGTWVTKASLGTTGKLDKYTGWINSNTHKIHTYAVNGKERENRHGSVITLTGEAAAKVRALAKTKGYTDTQLSNSYDDTKWDHSGWDYKISFRNPELGGKVVKYWYEDDVRQGIDFNNPNYRGKEIYDPASDGWYWLEAQYDGRLAVAVGTYDEKGNEISNWHENGDCQVAQPVDQEKYNKYGPEVYGNADTSWKWVRYDWEGKMVKCNDDTMRFYLDASNNGWYRYDEVTGAMQKGVWSYKYNEFTIYVYFDPTTGIRVDNQTININGYSYTFDEYGSLRTEVSGPISALPKVVYSSPDLENNSSSAEYAGYADPAAKADWEGWHEVGGVAYWYEKGLRQGYKPGDLGYRGKEIYDSASDAWYWLDNVQDGAVAKSKDVFQESKADDAGNMGKWVRYDANGHMIKGWCQGKDAKATAIKDSSIATNEDVYYFDPVYGTMAKGTLTIGGVSYKFDESTGILVK